MDAAEGLTANYLFVGAGFLLLIITAWIALHSYRDAGTDIIVDIDTFKPEDDGFLEQLADKFMASQSVGLTFEQYIERCRLDKNFRKVIEYR